MTSKEIFYRVEQLNKYKDEINKSIKQENVNLQLINNEIKALQQLCKHENAVKGNGKYIGMTWCSDVLCPDCNMSITIGDNFCSDRGKFDKYHVEINKKITDKFKNLKYVANIFEYLCSYEMNNRKNKT